MDNKVRIRFHNHKVMDVTVEEDSAGDAIIDAINTLSYQMSNDIDTAEYIDSDSFVYSSTLDKKGE